MRGSDSNRRSLRTALSLSFAVAIGLVAAASAGAATITSWNGPKGTVPQIVTASSTNCPGSVITINGTGFAYDGGTVSVTIGGVPAEAVVVGSDIIMYARVGASAQSGPVVVTTAKGSVTASPNAVVVPCQSTGTAATKPVVDAVAPQRAKAGKKLTLIGTGFVGTTGVTVDGEQAAYAIPSDGIMYVRVPADAKAGLLTILVTNKLGSAKAVFQRIG